MQFNISEEEEWECDEFFDENESSAHEKPPDEYLNNFSEDDEKVFIPSNSIAASHFCEPQGVTGSDVMDFEREIKDIIESVRNLQTALSEDSKVGHIFGLETVLEQEVGKMANGEENVKASIEEMEKMDAILRVKAAEERKAKLCRIQAEEESRDILSKLPCASESNVIKLNLEEFMRLLNDLGETESESSALQNLSQMDEAGDKEKSKNKVGNEKKTDNKNAEERKAKHLKFVEKNIQLAKCGRGTLSLTDEEKQRIEEILVEAEDSAGGNGKDLGAPHQSKGAAGAVKRLYAIDEETRSALTGIDRKLEAVAKRQSAERSGSRVSLLEKHPKEEDLCEKNDGEKGKTKERKKENRLVEINKLLNAANSVTQEEITPLSEEELESLLEESRRSLDEEESARREEKEGREMALPEGAATTHKESEDIISELVASAKLLMPKFKYRFVDS